MALTQSQIIAALEDPRREFVERYIGKALVALFHRQLEDEKKSNTARHFNTLGFSSSDARDGTITAKFFLKHERLEDWQIGNWKKEFRGKPRLAKYHRQLSEIAESKKKPTYLEASRGA